MTYDDEYDEYDDEEELSPLGERAAMLADLGLSAREIADQLDVTEARVWQALGREQVDAA